MKRIWLVVAAMVLLLAGVFLFAIPYWVGFQVEKTLRGRVFNLEEFKLQVLVTGVERGIRSSAVAFEVRVFIPRARMLGLKRDPGGRGPYLPLRGRGILRHGPLAFGLSPIRPFIAGADLSLSFQEDFHPEVLRYYFGDKPPLSLTVALGLDNSARVTFSVPDFAGAAHFDHSVRLQWAGAGGWIEIEGNRPGYTLEAALPVMEVGAPSGNLMLREIRLQGGSARRGQYIWLGETRLSIASFAFRGGQQQLGLEDFRYVLSLKEEAQGMILGLKAGVRKGSGKGFDLEPSNLEITVTGINRTVYEALLKKIRGLNKSSAAAGQYNLALMLLLVEYIPKFLEKPPRVEIAGVNLVTSQGALNLKGALEPSWVDPHGPKSRENLLAGSKANLSVKMTRSLVQRILAERLRGDLKALAARENLKMSEVERIQRIVQGARAQIEALKQQKFLTEAGDYLVSEWRYDKGVLINNGQERSALVYKLLNQ